MTNPMGTPPSAVVTGAADQPRRALDTSRARETFGFEARTDFEEGIRATVAWYEQHAGRLDTPPGA